jgi:hypothetical protein
MAMDQRLGTLVNIKIISWKLDVHPSTHGILGADSHILR